MARSNEVRACYKDTMKFKTCKRYNIPNHIHELTFSCYKNNNLLIDDSICQMLFKSILESKSRHNFSLLAFVIMPDHVHLLIRPLNYQYSISKILQAIKQPVSRKTSNQLKANQNRFWQPGDGYDRNIVTDSAVLFAINYIHTNPVRKGIVKYPEKYKWSSANPSMKKYLNSVY